MKQLTGTVARITYRNEENLYTVARLKQQGNDDLITIVGTFPHIHQGLEIVATGKWSVHKSYGKQFNVTSHQIITPKTTTGLIKYLSSDLIKGVGPRMAERLVKHFGLKVLDIIEKSPERLIEVEGIGPKTAKQIITDVASSRHIQDIYVFLQGQGLSKGYAERIYKQYREETIAIIKKNPYRLVNDIFGIGFKTADQLARSLGLAFDSPQRLLAGIKHVLLECSEAGHTYLPFQELVKQVSALLEVKAEIVPPCIEQLSQSREIIITTQPQAKKCVYLAPYYYAEQGVARALTQMIMWQQPNFQEAENNGAIAKFERRQAIKLALEQRQAVLEALKNGVFVITGGPGTGKTTIIRCILDILEKRSKRVLLAAPTGRAAKRMSEATERSAKTIHRLLEYTYDEGKGMRFKRNADNLLTADVIIVDEASMIDLMLMYHLVLAIPPGCQLIMVGDENQLPAVGAGNVLRDMISSGKIPLVKLERIFRQAQQSLIVTNAHRIHAGEMPITKVKDNDFFFIKQPEPEKVRDTIIELCMHRLPKYGNWHPINDIQVLTPMQRTITGVVELNKALQLALNPRVKGTAEWKRGQTCFRKGDKVMQIRNNYRKQVYNGDVGCILDINQDTAKVRVGYEEENSRRVVDYEFNELDELVLAYAITVHKSQGSEYPVVILPITTQHYLMLQRNLLYTAITRAKDLVVLVGTKKAMAIAVRNNKVKDRYTALAENINLFVNID